MSDGEGEIVLTFKDHTLYEGDLALLKPRQWLNDRLIGFYYESNYFLFLLCFNIFFSFSPLTSHSVAKCALSSNLDCHSYLPPFSLRGFSGMNNH